MWKTLKQCYGFGDFLVLSWYCISWMIRHDGVDFSMTNVWVRFEDLDRSYKMPKVWWKWCLGLRWLVPKKSSFGFHVLCGKRIRGSQMVFLIKAWQGEMGSILICHEDVLKHVWCIGLVFWRGLDSLRFLVQHDGFHDFPKAFYESVKKWGFWWFQKF